MMLTSLKDITDYLERRLNSRHTLAVVSLPEQISHFASRKYHVHKFWELKFLSPAEEEPHQITVVPPGVAHCSTPRDFSIGILHHIISIIGFTQSYTWQIFVSEEDDHHSTNLIPEILHIIRRYSGSAPFDSIRSDLIRTVMKNILALIRQNMSAPRTGKSKKIIADIALNYMEDYYHEADLSVADIARFTGVTPQYLNRVLVSLTGKTARKNLIDIRLNHSCELLETSRFLVKDVALFTGWKSQFYFSNSFRRAFGVTPHDWTGRKQTAEK